VGRLLAFVDAAVDATWRTSRMLLKPTASGVAYELRRVSTPMATLRARA
jgi:hypothetical protein